MARPDRVGLPASLAARLSAALVLGTLVLGALVLGTSGCGPPHVPPASAAQRARVHVTLYTTRWCPACAGARRWLEARGIPFDDRDVEASRADAARLATLNPARTVPVIDVEGRVLIGFVADELRRAVDTAAHRH